MIRYVTVREAAKALQLTELEVTRRLEAGRLAGLETWRGWAVDAVALMSTEAVERMCGILDSQPGTLCDAPTVGGAL